MSDAAINFHKLLGLNPSENLRLDSSMELSEIEVIINNSSDKGRIEIDMNNVIGVSPSFAYRNFCSFINSIDALTMLRDKLFFREDTLGLSARFLAAFKRREKILSSLSGK